MSSDDEIEFIAEYHGVDCSLCDRALVTGVHVCASGLPPDQDEAWCVNFCPECVGRIASALPAKEVQYITQWVPLSPALDPW